jgi:urease accessory protein
MSAATDAPRWRGHLRLDYTRDGERTVAHDRHTGPLRVLQRLYPEGPAVCHHVLVHPPGGIVGGDELVVEAALAEGCHALLTTPGAARFYRSAGASARQAVHARVAAGARLEWLPLETIAYSGCEAENRLVFELAPGAEMIGWDLLALGLPAAGQDFERGRVWQHLELPGTWLERGLTRADDRRLLDGPLGWAGRRVLATLWFGAGSALAPARREALLDAARAEADAVPGGTAGGRAADPRPELVAGATAPAERVVVLRLLADRVEPAMRHLQAVRAAWRAAAWGLEAEPPRIWRT